MALTAEDLRLIDEHIDARVADLRFDRADTTRLDAALQRLADADARWAESRAEREAAEVRWAESHAALEAAEARWAESRAEREAAEARWMEGQEKLESAVAQLTAGQAQLTAGQAQLTAGQAQLTAGQGKLESAVTRLTDGLDALRRQVGALADNVGFGLEDLAATFLPALLEKREGLVVSPLVRAFLPEGAAQPEEIDLMGTAVRDGDTVSVVVECKGRIYSREVSEFLAKVDRIASYLPHPPLAVMVGYVVHPSAQRSTDRVHFVTSHQL